MGNREIKVEHVTRVEGHGNIVVEIKGGQVHVARLDIVESPRFFEVMLQGRKYTDASWITSRICGICAVAHTTVSLKATEAAFGIVPSAQTTLLRKLAFHGEVLQSHVLHVYFLVSPDLFGTGSIVPLVQSHPGVVLRALRMKKLANDLCAVVAGRHVHPVSMDLDGFTKLPDPEALKAVRARLVECRANMDASVELFRTLKFPDFSRETEYISLKGVDEYPFIEGELVSSDGYGFPAADYKDKIAETVVTTSTTKHAKAARGSFMVGALARFNNNRTLLHPRAKAAADALGLSAPCHNPFMINAAQLVESVHCLEDAIAIIDRLLSDGLKDEPAHVRPAAGRVVGAVEAPRGALFHDYTYDEGGRITNANCIIPTGQNLANIDMDMRHALPGLLGMPDEDIAQWLKMLVRAYDPCISCSTHAVEVEIKRA